MKFYAIAYKFQEDVFYNFEECSDHLGLEPTCLLPIKDLAEQIIEEELSIDYVPVEINLNNVRENGNWSYSRGFVEGWDE